MLYTVSVGVRASLSGSQALSSACIPALEPCLQVGSCYELEAREITRVCTEIWWNPCEEGESLPLHQACAEVGDTAVSVTLVL